MRLTWPSRDDRPIEPEGARLAGLDRQPDLFGARVASQRSLVVSGDNVVALRALVGEGLAGKVDLAYLDPPYMSGVDYALEDEGGAKTHAYRDRWRTADEYLDMLLPCLRLVHRLLAPHGSIWVQVDHRASFLVHALLDEIFGAERFRNAIAWRRAPPLGRQAQSFQFPRNVDTLMVYAKGARPRFHRLHVAVPLKAGRARFDPERKRHYTLAPRGDYTDESIERLSLEGRVHRTPSGKVYVKYWVDEGEGGKLTKPRVVDSMWDDVAPLRHVPPSERTGYPTQKPEGLLERVVRSSSDPGDLVLDPFAGSGTTALVSARLGRRFITVDRSEVAVAVATKRLAAAGADFTVARAIDSRRE